MRLSITCMQVPNKSVHTGFYYAWLVHIISKIKEVLHARVVQNHVLWNYGIDAFSANPDY